MKQNVYVIGAYSTPVKKWPDKSHKQLVREAYMSVLADAGLENNTNVIDSVWVGNAGMNNWGQDMIRGQVVFTPIIEEGLLPERVSMFNVESACATASMAFQGAWRDILAGQAQVSVAVGFEKLFIPGNPELTLKQFSGGIDQIDKDRWMKEYQSIGDLVGTKFEIGPGRSMFMDTYAMQAQYHMQHYGVTQRQLAMVAAKNHNNGSLNEFAQYQFKMTVDEVMNDRPVVYPFTRAMCAPVADGAAAAILCSEEFYQVLPQNVKNRAVKVAACVNTSGKYRRPDELNLSYVASRRAYEMAGITAQDIDVVELHDATAFGEIFHSEMLGLCPIGEGGKLVESGETQIEGRIPINTSGGLIAKGHPIGATGLSMISELVKQLRGEAGARQVKDPEFALKENGGGAIGLEEASCSVVILQRTN